MSSDSVALVHGDDKLNHSSNNLNNSKRSQFDAQPKKIDLIAFRKMLSRRNI